MLLIAHRGASGHAPENTMAAFRLALAMGAKALELDVHQTKDHELVVIHDEDLKRVAGRKARVGALTRAQASAVDVGSWFRSDFSSERIPRLEEVMDLVQGRAELHIEVKKGSRLYPGIEERVADLLDRRRAWAWAPVSSFDHEALYLLRSISPKLRLGYLLGMTPMRTAWREMDELKAESLNLSLRQIDSRKVAECRRRGLKCLVYTVNAQKDADRLARLGVDGIYANFPELKV